MNLISKFILVLLTGILVGINSYRFFSSKTTHTELLNARYDWHQYGCFRPQQNTKCHNYPEDSCCRGKCKYDPGQSFRCVCVPIGERCLNTQECCLGYCHSKSKMCTWARLGGNCSDLLDCYEGICRHTCQHYRPECYSTYGCYLGGTGQCYSAKQCFSQRCENGQCHCSEFDQGCIVDKDCCSSTCSYRVCKCRSIGRGCLQHKDCCEENCWRNSCKANKHCREFGQTCSKTSSCCSGVCRNNACTYLSVNSSECKNDSHCLSKKCEGNRCSCTAAQGICFTDKDCCKGVCNVDFQSIIGTCECSKYLDICKSDEDCCEGQCKFGAYSNTCQCISYDETCPYFEDHIPFYS